MVVRRPLLDLEPPVRQLKSLLYGITDRALAAPTPCPDWTVADLLDHVVGLSWAFTRAARKITDGAGTSGPPPVPSAAHLPRLWRSRLPALLDDLATAWTEPGAWTGTARAGGVTLPAEQVGVVAVNELVVHGWDLARATGQDFAADPRVLEVLVGFLSRGPDGGTAGLFGPIVSVEDEAPLLEQVVGLNGRDPGWRPGSLRRPV